MGLTSQFQALVIGVGDYINLPNANLPATVKDAINLASVLRNSKYCNYPPDRVHVLTGEKATRENILHKLNLLARSRAINATTFIYFSGHGGRIGAISSHSSVYLLPRDTNPSMFQETAISGEEFSDALSKIKTGRVVSILDACYSNGVTTIKNPMLFHFRGKRVYPVVILKSLAKVLAM